jgi:predicted AAA+ superfamily ATPase
LFRLRSIRYPALEHYPIWETFVLEDLLRREALAHPHGQPHFWRTASGAEVDCCWSGAARCTPLR